MAQRVTIQLLDDLDGTTEASTTVTFGLDGTTYEIDLSEKNEQKLRKALEPFVQHGRRVKRTGSGYQTKRQSTKPPTREVREWARAQGIDLPERGRIPNAVMEQFLANAG